VPKLLFYAIDHTVFRYRKSNLTQRREGAKKKSQLPQALAAETPAIARHVIHQFFLVVILNHRFICGGGLLVFQPMAPLRLCALA